MVDELIVRAGGEPARQSKIMQKKCKNMHISVQKYLPFKQKRTIIENR